MTPKEKYALSQNDVQAWFAQAESAVAKAGLRPVACILVCGDPEQEELTLPAFYRFVPPDQIVDDREAQADLAAGVANVAMGVLDAYLAPWFKEKQS